MLLRQQGRNRQAFPVQGATAIGLAVDASDSIPALNPILVTDEFSFGLGVCGFGGVSSTADNFWQVRVNHFATQVGADQTILGGGDDVLWALVPAPVCDFNPPYTCQPTEPELSLDAPPRAQPGVPFTVRVTEYSDTGVPSAAVGAAVTGASQPTDASGATSVTLGSRSPIVASRSGSIPSQQLDVCVNAIPKKCPGGRGMPIFGSEREDAIGGTSGPDTIKARGDDDTVRVRGGGTDTVDCGAGSDLVRADRSDKVDKVSCEDVLRPKKKKHGVTAARQAPGSPEAVSDRRGTAAAGIGAALAALVLAAAGCGLGPGESAGSAELTVTRDYGSTAGASRPARSSCRDRRPCSGCSTAMPRSRPATAASSCSRSTACRELPATAAAIDWFFYVNGVESQVGAADVTPAETGLVGLPRLVERDPGPGRRRLLAGALPAWLRGPPLCDPDRLPRPEAAVHRGPGFAARAGVKAGSSTLSTRRG